MKFHITFLALKTLLLATTVSGKSSNERVINPNPPVSHTYSCKAQEQTCGKDTDRYYELVAGYNKYWVENFPS